MEETKGKIGQSWNMQAVPQDYDLECRKDECEESRNKN